MPFIVPPVPTPVALAALPDADFSSVGIREGEKCFEDGARGRPPPPGPDAPSEAEPAFDATAWLESFDEAFARKRD